MASYYGTQAWVLGSRDAGEADRIIFLYTQELGRIDALAKGVRASASKLRGHLNTFSKVRVLLTPGKELWRLLDAQAEVIPERARKLKSAEECRAFFLRVITHALPDLHMWEALNIFWDIDGREGVVSFKLRVLDALGILPEHLEKDVEGQIEHVLSENHML